MLAVTVMHGTRTGNSNLRTPLEVITFGTAVKVNELNRNQRWEVTEDAENESFGTR